MSHLSQPNIRIKVIFMLWSLLFTKCFLLEFLVRRYAVPINSLAYVWTLSILMASVATAVYAKIESEDKRAIIRRPGFAVFIAAALAVVFLVGWSLIASDATSRIALALATLTIGCWHLWNRIQRSQVEPAWLAPAWFVATAVFALVNEPTGFMVFAVSLFCFSVVPSLIQVLNSLRD